MKNPTPNVSCKFGAPLGRHTGASDPDTEGKFYLRHIPLDSGGYDAGGAYWGFGERLYWFCSADETAEGFLRANSRKAAKASVREDYPNAQFFN